MNTSKLFKNAIMNLYKSKIYTVDFSILKASDYADKNKINTKDYEELITYLAEEQEKSMKVEEIAEDIVENVEKTAEETTEEVEQTENKETAKEEE